MPDSGYQQGTSTVAPFEQRGRLLGSQFYDNTERDFVGIPIQAYKELSTKLENNYVKTQNAITGYEDARSKLSTNPYNKPLLEKMDKEWADRMQGINSDNYQDRVYDVEGIVSDLKIKFGGNVLAQNEADAAIEIEAIRKDPNLREKDKQLQEEEARKGYGSRFEIDEKTGQVRATDWTLRKLPPKYDFHDKALKLAQDIKANTFIDVDGKGRQITKLRPEKAKELQKLYGYHEIFSSEEVTPERLRAFLTTYFDSDSEATAYHESRAEAFTKNIPKTIDEVAKLYTQAEIDAITGKQGSTLEDLSNTVNNDIFTIEELLKKGWEKNDTRQEERGAINAAVIGKSYVKEDVRHIEDRAVTAQLAEEAEARKAARAEEAEAREAARASKVAKEQAQSLVSDYNVNVSAVLQGNVTQADITAINDSIPVLQQNVEKVTGEYNDAYKEFENIKREEIGKDPNDIESKKRIEEAQNRLNQRQKIYIEAENKYNETLKLQYDLGKATVEIYEKTNKTKFSKDYNDALPDLKKTVLYQNNRLVNKGIINGTLYKVSNDAIEDNKRYKIKGKDIYDVPYNNRPPIKKGKVINGNYFLYRNELDDKTIKSINKQAISEKGINPAFIRGEDGEKIGYSVPTQDEVNRAVLRIANNEDGFFETGALTALSYDDMGSTTKVSVVGGVPITREMVKKAKAIKKAGTLQETLNKTFSSKYELYTSKNNPAGKDSMAATMFENIKKDNQRHYDNKPGKFLVPMPNGEVMSVDKYLLKNYEDQYEAIDQSKGVVQLTTKYNAANGGYESALMFKAKAGKEANLPNGMIKIPVVNTEISDRDQTKNGVANAYKAMISDDKNLLSNISDEAKIEMGRAYGSVTPFGDALAKANLWAKPLDNAVTVPLKGNHYDSGEELTITPKMSIRESDAFNNKDYEIKKGDDILVKVNGQVMFYNEKAVFDDLNKNKGNSKFSLYYASSPQEIEELIGINLLKSDVEYLTSKKE